MNILIVDVHVEVDAGGWGCMMATVLFARVMVILMIIVGLVVIEKPCQDAMG